MVFLRRNIRSASQQAKSTAHKTPVRPNLEYASTVWTPHDTDSNQLEMVQRRAVRFVKSDYSRTSTVTAMRQNLGWDTLQQRRDQARLSMVFRITHQQVDIPAERYLTPLALTTEPEAINTLHVDSNIILRLPSTFHPQNDRAVESTPASSSEPVNAGGLTDPASIPHI